MCKNNTGFTLAETLISIVILGIVAVLTVSNLVQYYTEKSYVVKLKKVYATLQNAFDMSKVYYGEIPGDWAANKCSVNVPQVGRPCNANAVNNSASTTYPYAYFLPLASKNCYSYSSTIQDDCYLSEDDKPVRSLDGTEKTDWWAKMTNTEGTRLLLKDGTFVVLVKGSANTDAACNSGKVCFYIDVDINGKKGPNQLGKDIFRFIVTKNQGVIPDGGNIDTSKYTYTNKHNSTCKDTTQSGFGCAAWVIEKGNMQYLHKTTTWE